MANQNMEFQLHYGCLRTSLKRSGNLPASQGWWALWWGAVDDSCGTHNIAFTVLITGAIDPEVETQFRFGLAPESEDGAVARTAKSQTLLARISDLDVVRIRRITSP